MTTEVIVQEIPTVTAVEPVPPPVDTAPLAEAAVEVAQIEAERDVRIAEINAEITETINEAATDAEQEGKNEWQRSIETQLAEQQTMLQSILTKLTPPEPSPPSLESESVGGLQEAESRLEKEPTENPRPNKRRWI